MTWQDVTPEAVLAAVQAGHTTRGDLAGHFGVLPSSAFLCDAIELLVADRRLHDHGTHLVPLDLLEPLTDKALED